MATAGKTHLSHLFNFNKSTQMKPVEFLELIDYIKENGNVFSEDAFNVSEKIDGSTTVVGYDDEGIFVSKCGYSQNFRKNNAEGVNGKAAAFLEIVDNGTFPAYLDELRKKYKQNCIRVQIEMLLAEFSRSSKDLQVILVPYKKEMFGSKGGAFIVRVIGDDLQPLPNQDELLKECCACLDTNEFIVRPITDTKIDFEPINLNGFISEFDNELKNYTDEVGIINPKNKEIITFLREKQQALQAYLTDHFTSSKYGDFYEGLVVSCKNGMTFKMTSEKFKEKFAEFNSKGDDIPIPEETGVWPVQHMAREILVNHIGPDCKPVACLMGHFAPFTGPKGHGRMFTAMTGLTNKFIVGVPESKQPFDKDRNMFTPQQRVEIINDFMKENEFEGKAILIRPDSPSRMCVSVLKAAVDIFGNKIRPVFVVGPDRADMLSKYPDFNTDLNTTFPEKNVLTDRGENNVSGTMIRKLIIEGDVEKIASLTGYSEEIAEKLVNMYESNLSSSF